MAKKAVYVDLSKYPELYDKLVKLAEENYTTPPPLVRKFIREGLEIREHANKPAGKGKPKIRQDNQN
jgi:hypothetical protein